MWPARSTFVTRVSASHLRGVRVVKRTFKILAVCLIALVLFSAIAVSLVIWALNTAEGTRVLLKVVSIVSPLGIDAGEITGRIRDDLRIRDLRLRLGQMEMRADRFRLRWEAGRLLDRKVLVHDLSLEGVQIRDNRPESKEVSIPGWPAAPFWLSRPPGPRGILYRQEPELPPP